MVSELIRHDIKEPYNRYNCRTLQDESPNSGEIRGRKQNSRSELKSWIFNIPENDKPKLLTGTIEIARTSHDFEDFNTCPKEKNSEIIRKKRNSVVLVENCSTHPSVTSRK